jgi:hypothetical protein
MEVNAFLNQTAASFFRVFLAGRVAFGRAQKVVSHETVDFRHRAVEHVVLGIAVVLFGEQFVGLSEIVFGGAGKRLDADEFERISGGALADVFDQGEGRIHLAKLDIGLGQIQFGRRVVGR